MPERWYWVSFANEHGPQGALFVPASSEAAALRAAQTSLPAGCSAMAWLVPVAAGAPPIDSTNRRLTHPETIAAWRRWMPSAPEIGIVELEIDLETRTATTKILTEPGDDVSVS